MILRMPKLGMEMAEGTLARWLVDDGAQVTAGAPLYEVETEKVENEIGAPVSGTVRLIATAGETYAVGEPVAEILEG